MEGYDTAPAFSPDGNYLAWLSMERDGYESDRNRLFLLDCKTAVKNELPTDWDYTINEFAWAPDGKSIIFIAPKDGVAPVFEVSLKSRKPVALTDVQADFASLQVTPDHIVTMMHSMLRPNEVMTIARHPKGASASYRRQRRITRGYRHADRGKAHGAHHRRQTDAYLGGISSQI